MKNKTLRQSLLEVNIEKVYDILFQKDKKMIYDNPPTSRLETKNMYEPVIRKLHDIPGQKPGMPIQVYWVESNRNSSDHLYEPTYLDVQFINPTHENYPEGLKPWGGSCEIKNDAPEGHYNVNWKNYNQFFGLGFTPWNEMIESEFTKPDNISWEDAVAVFLWELTFYGWTWEDQKIVLDEIIGETNEYKNQKSKK
jgi:hypothetical protein